MNRKVSLIVPAYNVKKYIRKCIISIENQTYQNYEIIIIDDGSTDGTSDIILEAAAGNPKIKVLNGGHKGVSNARNMGLDYVEGDYVTFVDSDDFLCENYLEKLVSWLEQENVDLAICGTNDVSEEEKIVKQSVQIGAEILDNDQFLSDIVLCKKYTCTVWGKIYKYEFIKNLRFDTSISISEDFKFLYYLSLKIKKVYYNSMPLYNWLVRSNSALHTARCRQTYRALSTHEEIMKEIEPSGDLFNSIEEGYIIMCMECMKQAKAENDKEIISSCKRKISKRLGHFLLVSKMALIDKIKIIIKCIIW